MKIHQAIREAHAGSGVPRTRIIIDLANGEMAVWEPSGEVKTLRRLVPEESLPEKATA